jgi:hypothetical protein
MEATMARYLDIQSWIKENFHFVPKFCWIAHVMSDFGLTTRVAGNRLNPDARTNPLSARPAARRHRCGTYSFQDVARVTNRAMKEAAN